MNIFYILDRTTLFILLPQIFQLVLVLVAAYQKGCYPWPTQHAIRAIDTGHALPRIEHVDIVQTVSENGLTTLQAVRSEVLTYLLCTAIGSAVFLWCTSHLFWPISMPLTDLHLMVPAFINMCISFSLTLPVLWHRQLVLFRKGTMDNTKSILSSSQFILGMSVLTGAILITLPVIQLLGIGLGLSNESARVMRDVFRVFYAFSTIPTSISGFAIISSGAMIRRRKVKAAVGFLNSDDVSRLDLKTVDELHYLIEVAIKHGKIDTADRISTHLLRRVENS